MSFYREGVAKRILRCLMVPIRRAVKEADLRAIEATPTQPLDGRRMSAPQVNADLFPRSDTDPRV